jgi:hypothetical protein
MFSEFMEPLDEEGTKALFKTLFNRCAQAFNEIYEYEQEKMGSLWRFDERFYEQGIEILYERYCYAMAIIVDKFHKECSERHGLVTAQRRATTFYVYLSGCVDQVFKRRTRDMGWSDTTETYYMEDYFDDDDAYDSFWDKHQKLQSEVTAVRNSFCPEERTFLHGFSYNDTDNTDRDNRDFLHVMRIHQGRREVDVEKFLGDTKRFYLPKIIRAFLATPKIDYFATQPSSKWWQFWKGAKAGA